MYMVKHTNDACQSPLKTRRVSYPVPAAGRGVVWLQPGNMRLKYELGPTTMFLGLPRKANLPSLELSCQSGTNAKSLDLWEQEGRERTSKRAT